ncbi:substrate-binding domain-containing protein [Pseudomonas qingdaonensis]|nr:substrate-binding domain-containing protein [Pseudomonas qingdaonensis]
MLADLDHWAMDIEAMTQGRAAHLNVGVIPFLPGRLLATAINQTRSCGKRISVTLHEGSSAHLLERLQAHELDCVIGRTSALPDVPDLQHEVLYHQEPRLIAHERLAMHLNQRPLDLQALARLDWVLGPRQTPIREQLIDFFLNAGITPLHPWSRACRPGSSVSWWQPTSRPWPSCRQMLPKSSCVCAMSAGCAIALAGGCHP